MLIPKRLLTIFGRTAHHEDPVDIRLGVWVAEEKHMIDAVARSLEAAEGPTEEWFLELDRRLVPEAADGVELELERWAEFVGRETEAVARRLRAEGPTPDWFAALDRRIDGDAEDDPLDLAPAEVAAVAQRSVGVLDPPPPAQASRKPKAGNGGATARPSVGEGEAHEVPTAAKTKLGGKKPRASTARLSWSRWAVAGSAAALTVVGAIGAVSGRFLGARVAARRSHFVG